MKLNFEFYMGDILGIIAFFVFYKIGSILFLILLALLNSVLNKPDLVNGLVSMAPLIGFIIGAWIFYMIHAHYKRRSLSKKNVAAS